MKMGTIRPAIILAIVSAAAVVSVAIFKLGDADHIVTVSTGFTMAVLGLGNKLVEADTKGDSD